MRRARSRWHWDRPAVVVFPEDPIERRGVDTAPSRNREGGYLAWHQAAMSATTARLTCVGTVYSVGREGPLPEKKK